MSRKESCAATSTRNTTTTANHGVTIVIVDSETTLNEFRAQSPAGSRPCERHSQTLQTSLDYAVMLAGPHYEDRRKAEGAGE